MHTHTHEYNHFPADSRTHTNTHPLMLAHSLSDANTLSQTRPHTHMHTHIHSHTHTHTHTLTHSHTYIREQKISNKRNLEEQKEALFLLILFLLISRLNMFRLHQGLASESIEEILCNVDFIRRSISGVCCSLFEAETH